MITTILRHYSGTFSDFTYIEENAIAQYGGITRQQVYMVLKNLSARNIVNFIPQRSTPLITYTKDREDGDKIIIPANCYDERKNQFVKQIDGILNYINNNDICRSRQLLLYFGEETKEDCQQCDVCVGHRHEKRDSDNEKNAEKVILDILADREKHHFQEFKNLSLPEDLVAAALEVLVSEERVRAIDDCFFIDDSEKETD